jgi:hypothetical protein
MSASGPTTPITEYLDAQYTRGHLYLLLEPRAHEFCTDMGLWRAGLEPFSYQECALYATALTGTTGPS